MTRREMLGATAAAFVLPLLESRPLAALTTRYNFAARVFSPAEFALVDELSDIIIPTDDVSPGARAARVAGEIDRRLADSLDTRQQQQWRDGLRAVNDLAREMAGKTFMPSRTAATSSNSSAFVGTQVTRLTSPGRWPLRPARWSSRATPFGLPICSTWSTGA